MDGLLLVHKPKDITSHDVVYRLRKVLHIKKVGHFGTLDPLATGLMLVALGKATRLFRFFLHMDKTYEGKIRLGWSTDTYDAYGHHSTEESKDFPDGQTLLRCMKEFEGEIDQIAPPFSAKKHKGKPLYALARKKKAFELKTSRVTVHFFRLKTYTPPIVDFSAKCSSGTYIRSLAHELGQKLGCGAHLFQLTRTKIGNFHLNDSYTVDEIERLAAQGKTKIAVLSLENLLPELPSVIISNAAESLIRHGNEFFSESVLKILPGQSSRASKGTTEKNIFKVYTTQGKLIAFAKSNAPSQSYHPFLVTDSEASNP
jgi:tRNA pseudouridine55 synthase